MAGGAPARLTYPPSPPAATGGSPQTVPGNPPMKALLKAAALPVLALAAAACQVNVDENTAERIDNATDRLENAAEEAAAGTEKAAEDAAATLERAAERIEKVDVDVRTRDGNEAAGNGQ